MEDTERVEVTKVKVVEMRLNLKLDVNKEQNHCMGAKKNVHIRFQKQKEGRYPRPASVVRHRG